MKRDPETRLIDASELRGRLAELLCDGPTTVYRRAALAPAVPSSEPAQSPEPAASYPETQLLHPRNLTPAPYGQASLAVDVPSGGSVVVARPARRAPVRLLVLSAGTAVAVASLVYGQLGRTAPAPAQLLAQRPRSTAPAIADAVAEPPSGGAPTAPKAPADPLAQAAPQTAPCARDALRALVEGRRRDALMAYRTLGAAEPYPAVVRILERELQRETDRRSP